MENDSKACIALGISMEMLSVYGMEIAKNGRGRRRIGREGTWEDEGVGLA